MKRSTVAVAGGLVGLGLLALGWWLWPPLWLWPPALWLWPPALPSEPRFLSLELPELRIWARSDQVAPLSPERELDILGDAAVIWLESAQELGPVVFQVSGRPGKIVVRSSGSPRQYEPPPSGGESRFFFEWQPEKARRDEDRPGFFYRLFLSFPDRSEHDHAGNSHAGNNHAGNGHAGNDSVRLAVVGTRAFLDLDFYHVDWLGCGAPETVAAGEEILVLAHARNTSPYPWPHEGHARVRLTSRWLASRGLAAGGAASEAGPRTDLKTEVAPQGETEAWLRVLAPSEPGRYGLEIDFYFEPIAWFSERTVPTCRVELDVE